jgi:thioredoxin 1
VVSVAAADYAVPGLAGVSDMDWISVLIGVFIVVFVAFNFLPLWRARRARGHAVPALDPFLTDAQRRAPRLLVYFWSPSCGMCRAMTPVIDRLAAEHADVVKINAAEAREIARECGVMATPSLAVIEQGVVRRLVVGARSEAQIRALRVAGY